jgi:hypothetical protein
MRHEFEHGLPFATEIDEGFRTAKRRLGMTEKIENDLFRLSRMRFAVGLGLGPAGAGDKEQFCVGLDRLSVGGGRRGGRQ